MSRSGLESSDRGLKVECVELLDRMMMTRKHDALPGVNLTATYKNADSFSFQVTFLTSTHARTHSYRHILMHRDRKRQIKIERLHTSTWSLHI